MNIEEIDKWLDNEYGCSYTRLEELRDFLIDRNMKYQDELERYKNIIDKAKKLCEDSWGTYYWECGNGYEDMMNILEGKELKGE